MSQKAFTFFPLQNNPLQMFNLEHILYIFPPNYNYPQGEEPITSNSGSKEERCPGPFELTRGLWIRVLEEHKAYTLLIPLISLSHTVCLQLAEQFN